MLHRSLNGFSRAPLTTYSSSSNGSITLPSFNPASNITSSSYCCSLGGVFQPTHSALMFHQTTPLYLFAHWYAGKHKRHRYAREKRYDPKYNIAKVGRNKFTRKLSWKTNRWNYLQAHRDMP